MSKLDELIQQLCPNGVEFKSLGEIGKVSMCKRILKSETSVVGEIPFYKIGTFGKTADAFISKELFDKYRSEYSYPKQGDILISAAGTIGRTVIFDGKPAYFQDSNIVWIDNDESLVLNKYLYYYYQLEPWKIASGGTITRLYNDNIRSVQLPVPPLPVQAEIVRILDKSAELTAELTARKKQYEYYKNSLLTFDHTIASLPLNDVINFRNGKEHEKNIVSDGKYIVVNSKFISADGLVKKYSDSQIEPLFVDDILMVMSDLPNGKALAKCFLVEEDDKYTLNQRICALSVKDKNAFSTKFLYYYLNRNWQLLKFDNGCDQTNLKKADILNIRIPIVSFSEQEHIVSILDRFDTLCNDLTSGLPAEIEARQKQYEYYRDKLLSFENIKR